MRLYLAVAVLVLAFVAYAGGCCVNYKPLLTLSSVLLCNFLCLCPSLSPAEAQEESFEDKLSRFGEQVSEIGKNLAEKAKTTFQELHNSEFAANTR